MKVILLILFFIGCIGGYWYLDNYLWRKHITLWLDADDAVVDEQGRVSEWPSRVGGVVFRQPVNEFRPTRVKMSEDEVAEVKDLLRSLEKKEER